MEKRQTIPENLKHIASLKYELTRIEQSTPKEEALAFYSKGFWDQHDEKKYKLYVAKKQFIFLIDNLYASPETETLLATLDVLADSVYAERGSSDTRLVNPPQRLLARAIINSYTTITNPKEAPMVSIATDTAKGMKKLKETSSARGYIIDLVMEDLKFFSLIDSKTDSQVHRGHPLLNLDEKGIASILLLIESLTSEGVIDKSFLYKRIIGVSISQSQPAFIGLLHQG